MFICQITNNLQELIYDMNIISSSLVITFWTSHCTYESKMVGLGHATDVKSLDSNLGRCLPPALSCINDYPSTLILKNFDTIFLVYMYNYQRKIVLLYLGSVHVIFFLKVIKVSKAMLS